jgi:hypothetical protein
MGWIYGSNSRVSALQMGRPEFKLQSHPKNKDHNPARKKNS